MVSDELVLELLLLLLRAVAVTLVFEIEVESDTPLSQEDHVGHLVGMESCAAAIPHGVIGDGDRQHGAEGEEVNDRGSIGKPDDRRDEVDQVFEDAFGVGVAKE